MVHLIEDEGEKELVDIKLETGEVITATGGHPFYEPKSKSWIDAKNLVTGQLLLSLLGSPVDIAHLENYTQQAKVYNLTVADDHTYYVGRYGVLSHNSGVCDIAMNQGFPLGFKNVNHYGSFINRLKSSNFPEDAKFLFQGSSVTGRRHNPPYTPFGAHSDYDVGVASKSLFDQASKLGFSIRHGNATRIGPLDLSTKKRIDMVKKLGLYDDLIQLQNIANRKVGFMIYEDYGSAVGRNPSWLVQ